MVVEGNVKSGTISIPPPIPISEPTDLRIWPHEDQKMVSKLISIQAPPLPNKKPVTEW